MSDPPQKKTPPPNDDGGASDTSTTASGTRPKGSTPKGADQPMWVYVSTHYGHARRRFKVRSVHILAPTTNTPRPPGTPEGFDVDAIEGIANLEAADGAFWSVQCRRKMADRLLERLDRTITLILHPKSAPMLPMGHPVPDHLLPPSARSGGAQ